MSEIFDLEAEKAVLSCICTGGENAFLKLNGLTAEDFYSKQCALVFTAIAELMKQQSAVDVVTISDRLRQKGNFEKCGGIQFLSSVLISVGTSIGVEDYAAIVREKAERRRLIPILKQACQLTESGDYNKLLEALDNIKPNNCKSRSNLESVPEIFERFFTEKMEQRETGAKLTGVATGFRLFDRGTGGLQNSDLIILAARPSMGKTAFMLEMAMGVAKNQSQDEVIIFSLEMNKNALVARMTSSYFKINNQKWKSPDTITDDDIKEMRKMSSSFEDVVKNIYIHDDPQMTMNEILTVVLERIAKNGGKAPSLICIDYLQQIVGNGNESPVVMFTKISRELKVLARKIGCPVVCLSQLSRKCEERADKRPMLSDLRETGAIEQDADIVGFLYRDEYYFPESEAKNQAELIIQKHRNGAVGTFNFVFMKEYTAFREMMAFDSSKR